MTTSYRYASVGTLLEQATGGASEIAFSYAYNKAGSMTEKVLTSTDGIETTLKMSYNKANQLTGMANAKDKITYKYDKNGSMVQKVLSSQSYGKLTDSYAYNALDQLTEYVGYDGYRQAFTYDANGMRLSRSEAGDANRSTLEELLRENIAGLPEIVEPTQSQTNADEADMPAGLEWATTEYLYDLTQEYYQVISETTTYANGTSATTAYAYGLERSASYSTDSKVEYVYDGRGSVAQTVNAPVAGAAVSSALPDVGVQVQTFSYTAFGEQMGDVKISGFTYNAEAYDAATGMLNLRARQYEPALNRFYQKDIVRGQITSTLSLNRYAYCFNNPVMYTDPSGESVLDSIGNWWNKAKQTALGQFVDIFVVQPIVKKVKKIANAVAPIAKAAIKSAAEKAAEEYNTEAFLLFSAILKKVDNDGVYYSDKFRDVVESMQNELQSLDPSNVNYKQSTQEIVAKYCEYFNEYEKQRSNSDHAFESLTQWMDRSETEEKDYYWVLDGRNLFRQLADNSDVYSPQVKALFGKYSTMVISEQKTTLSNVILSKSDKETINKTKECLEEFYDSLKVILYPNGIKQTSENLPSEEISVIENPFGSVITAKNWNSYYGDKQSMSEEDWRIYIGYLIELNNEGRLQYGTAYTADDGSHTSLKYTKDTLYIDCWGLIKTGAKINLSKEVVDSLSLNGPVNRIYESLSQKGEIIVEQNDDPRLGNTYPNLETGYSIFIDNTDRTEGYDHVMIYVRNLYYPDTNGTLIKNAVVGIGSIKEGLQIYDLDEYLPKWINEGKDVRWGNQFE